MKWMRLVLGILLAAGLGEATTYGGHSVVIRSAARVQFPGVVHEGAAPQQPGDIDCSSPVHWDDGTMYMFSSTGHPFRSSGPNLFHSSRPSVRTSRNRNGILRWEAKQSEGSELRIGPTCRPQARSFALGSG